jgi:hypothetical protein
MVRYMRRSNARSTSEDTRWILVNIYIQLAEIPGVARDSIRNEGTREINYGSCISASRPERKTPRERAPGTQWIEA